MDVDPQFGIGVLFSLTSFVPFCLLSYKQYLTESNSFDLHHPHLEGTFTSLRVMSGPTPLQLLDIFRSPNRNYALVFWPSLFFCSPYAGTDL